MLLGALAMLGGTVGGCAGSGWSRSGGYGYSYSVYDDCHAGGAEDLGFYALVIGTAAVVHALFHH